MDGEVSAEMRERLGRLVREEWIAWAKEQSNPKPSWLVPWDGLSEPDKEVDRRIGERLFREGTYSRLLEMVASAQIRKTLDLADALDDADATIKALVDALEEVRGCVPLGELTDSAKTKRTEALRLAGL